MKLKTAWQRLQMSHININRINVFFYCKYFVFKILDDSVQQKPMSEHFKSYGRSVATAAPVDLIATKVVKH